MTGVYDPRPGTGLSGIAAPIPAMKTFSAKNEEQDRKWFIIDANKRVIGAVAVEAANLLRGKNKVTYTPHIDNGDHVVIINAEKIRVTGAKAEQKVFYWHTGYAGGIKERTVRERLESKYPERVIEKAVERMITRGPLGREQMRSLHVYAGTEHPHAGQQPTKIDIAALNRKNSVLVKKVA